ncbi:MAG: formate dehydrogenase accessory sulfurtransferase FdhD [Candidatus Geothermarchaeales archaeon]
MSSTTRIKSVKINLKRNLEERVEEEVALEVPITIYVNHEHIVTLFATPTQRRELAIGHLLGEGIIKRLEEIKDVKIRNNDVHVELQSDVAIRVRASKTLKVVSSACGSTEDFYKLLDRIDRPHVKSDFSIQAQELSLLARELSLRSRYARRTARHSAGLFLSQALVAYSEDVGRHNAVDKAIGMASLDGIDFNHSVLITTGRQSADMVLKAARVGIPLSVSIRGPLYSGIFAAWKTRVTLVAYAKGSLMRIYTHPERVLYTSKTSDLVL